MSSINKPRGRVPNHVKDALEHDPYMWPMLVCPTCGKWVSEVDHLFPYHSEHNKCRDCGYFIDQKEKK